MGDFMDYCCKICPSCYRISDLIHYAFITPGENGPWEGVPCERKYIPVMVQVCPQTRINKEKSPSLSAEGFGPSGESRTHGLLNPIQARYQTALHPDIAAGVGGK